MRALALLPLLLLCSCAGVLQDLTTRPASLRYLGGLKITGRVRNEGGREYLPVAIIPFAWPDSAMTLREVETRVHATAVFVTAVTSFVGPHHAPHPLGIEVARLRPGQYVLLYEDPGGALHYVGTFEVPKR